MIRKQRKIGIFASPAKGVVSEMAARVQIPASPPKSPEIRRFRGFFFFGKVQQSTSAYICTNNTINNILTVLREPLLTVYVIFWPTPFPA